MCELCNTIEIISELSTDYITQVNSLYDGIATKIWKGEFTGAIDESLTKAMAVEFQRSIEAAYGHSLNGMKVSNEHFTFLTKAERSAYEFSTAKCQRLISDLKSYKNASTKEKEFKKAAFSHFTNMTQNHQETEAIFAEGEVNKALRWREIKSQMNEFPIGEYVAVHDERVRASHFAIDGTRLPWNHPWWKSHRPPIDYRCRCKAIQDSNISNLTAHNKLINYNVKKPFINKYLDDGVIFSNEHSYFQKLDLKANSRIAADLAPWRAAYKRVFVSSFMQIDKYLNELPFAKVLSEDIKREVNFNPYFGDISHSDFIIDMRKVPPVGTNEGTFELKNVTTARRQTISNRLKDAKKGQSVIIGLDAEKYNPHDLINAVLNRHRWEQMAFVYKGKIIITEGINATSEAFTKKIQDFLK